MNNTQKAKKLIREILSDNMVHRANDIKKYVEAHDPSCASEGTVSGALRLMKEHGDIKKMGRGMYKMNDVKDLNVMGEKETIDDNYDEVPKSKSIKKRIIELTNMYKENFVQIINEIDITEENKKIILECMELRKKIDDFSKQLEGNTMEE